MHVLLQSKTREEYNFFYFQTLAISIRGVDWRGKGNWSKREKKLCERGGEKEDDKQRWMVGERKKKEC